MSFPKITINNYNKSNNYHLRKLELKIINPKYKIQSKKMNHNFTSNNSLNYNNYVKQKALPMKFKLYNIVLPILGNSKKDENINISKSTNNKFKKNIRKGIEIYNYYHPWINNSYNNYEINEFMSNCYDITKIDAPNNDENKYRINESKLTNKLLRDVEKHYKIANIFQRTKLKNIKSNNIRIKINKQDLIENNILSKRRHNRNIDNLIYNDYNNFKFYNPINKDNKRNKTNSLENTYSSLSNKNINKEDLYKKDSRFKDFLSLKKLQKPSSSLNTSYSPKINNNINELNEDCKEKIFSNRSVEIDNSPSIKNEYKTIKIKKLMKNTINDKYKEEKNNRIEKIKSNLLFKKNITFSTLFPNSETQRQINKSNLIKKPIKIIFQ